tara:strand:+ start:2588 stop:5890 length:3303 start_codon:yes stop_codon:yes gene_type:complete
MASDTDRIVAAMESLAASNTNLKQVANSFDNFDVMRLVDALEQATNVSQQNTAQLESLVDAHMKALDTQLKSEKQADEQESQRQKNHDEWIQQTAKQIKLNKDLERQFGDFGKGIADLGKGFNIFTVGIGKLGKKFHQATRGISGWLSGKFTQGLSKLKGFGGIGKFAKGAAAVGKAALGGVKGFYDKLKLGLNAFLASNPIALAVKKIGGFIFNKTVGKMLGATAKIFKMGIQYGTQFAKVMVGLPLQILGSVAKIGHAFRKDVIEVVGGAIENTKEFMDVSDGLGASIKALSDSESTSLDKFLNVRSDFVKMFGKDAGGKAQLIAELQKGVESMGQLADTVGDTISRNIDNAMYFVKATRSLGMAGDDIAYITAEAVKNGESIYTALDRVVIAGDATAKQFGVDRKKLSKNFFVLRKDIINFGHLSDRQIMETSAKLTQMGLSMQEAAAVFGKIDTFESAAQTSAMLSQTFGMNLDALQLLRAEKPEEIIEQFRDAMLSTGRSFDQLNRHEKELMRQHTGLSAESLKMTMNYRNLGMSYKDIQKKMKEDDPTQQQIKNLELMSGSLKEIKRTISGENVFTEFTDGVLEAVKANSGLSDVLLRVSERFEDFFVSGLQIGEKAKGAVEKAFTPFRNVLENLVGDGKTNKGLLDADKFKGVFEEFAITTGDYLGRAFKGENLKSLQGEIRNTLKSTFDFDTLNQGNTIVGKLFTTSGEIIGQMLKAFAAFGPGIIDTVMDAFDGLVDFLWNYESQMTRDNSIVGMLQDLFKLSDNDTDAILDTFTHLIKRVTSSGGPLMKLYFWMNSKFLGLMESAFSSVSQVAADSLFGYSSPLYQVYKYTLGPVLDFLGMATGIRGIQTMSNDQIMEAGRKKFKGTSIRSLDLEKISGDSVDEQQASDLGRIAAALEDEMINQKNDSTKTQQLQNILSQINNAKGSFWDKLDNDKFVKEIAKEVADYRGITLDIEQANGIVKNAQDKLLGPGKMATLTATPDGLNVTQYAVGDNLVAAKPSEISYGGDAASGFQSVSSISAQQNVGQASMQGPTELTVRLEVDGNTLTEVVLDSDLVGKMTRPIKGRKVLSDGSVVDPGGSRIQGSSLR